AMCAVGQQTQPDVDSCSRNKSPLIRNPVAARDLVPVDAHQIERASLAGVPGLRGAILRVDAAHAGWLVRRHHRHGIPRADASGKHGSGYERSETCEGEDSIDSETQQTIRVTRRTAASARTRSRN